jgi:hypothetical protein
MEVPKDQKLDISISQSEKPAHCFVIEEQPSQADNEPWYTDIKRFLETGEFLAEVTTTDRRTITRLAAGYTLGGGCLYKKPYNQMLLHCVDKTEAGYLMLEVHAGTCGPHMNRILLAKKIMLLEYYWTTMEIDYYKFVCKCHRCQIHGNLIYTPLKELYNMASP